MCNESKSNNDDRNNDYADLFAEPIQEQPESDIPDSLQMYTFAECAKIMRCCQKTVENIARVRKEIPIVRVGNRPLIRRQDLEAYIARGGSRPDEVETNQTDRAKDGGRSASPRSAQGRAPRKKRA